LVCTYSSVHDERIKSSQVDSLFTLYPTILSLFKIWELSKTIQIRAGAAAIGQIASQIAHDIRSPLAVLNSVVVKSLSISNDDREILQSVVKRINSIAQGLLDRAKNINATKDGALVQTPTNAIPRCTMLDLSNAIREIAAEKAVLFENSKRRLTLSGIDTLADLSKKHVNGSVDELSRVLSNIINNSLESLTAPDGNVLINVQQKDQFLRIDIHDNGQGMPQSVVNRIGREQFSHGKESSSESGSGLGLYHAFNTIKSWNGTIKIESQERAGTSVEIALLVSEQ
jgi:signal transduction histidine kinase